ncbi:GNAT family N-acetyltransferase [Methylobacterium oryzihabitans]|uniref:GNAT family N-acetyltransferase n=1 Tax=Methylobacterium oryzihabitans TaxID=2499852 RepID=UPI001FE941F9|nr:GNAT family N-acetyltransferase [Methylobacterium oryzihabitans]
MSGPPRVVPLISGDLGRVLALNNAHAVETSLLDEARLQALHRGAFRATGIGGGEAFLIALDQDADYASPNFLWFRERYPRFVYVDRVVTAPACRGLGLARALYRDLFAAAGAAGHGRVVCEVNSDPPNPVSAAFHAGLGFREVGAASVAPGGKVVRYLLRALPDDGDRR